MPRQYYPDSKNSHNGEIPAIGDQCLLTNSGDNRDVLWEGTTLSCRFSTGVQVTTHIQEDAAGKAVGTSVG